MIRLGITILTLILAVTLCACAANAAGSNTPAPTTLTSAAETTAPAPSPSPAPAPLPTGQDILERIQSVDVLSFIPAGLYTPDETTHNYELITAQPETAYALPGQYDAWLQSAKTELERDPLAASVTLDSAPPSWQLLSVLACNYANDPAALADALASACDFTIAVTPGEGDGNYSLHISAAPKDPVGLFYSLPASGRVSPLMNLFSYAYISTIYDDEMNVKDGIGTPPLPTLLFPIENPGQWYFDDTWYAGRDGGARRHTGTDINAPEGTNLLACVDGEIFDAGVNAGAGNYVVVRGADGTQYHYYHMVRPTELQVGDTVKAGGVVGHVGNTGNSTANHLHFTIITADGQYLNPYSYLVDAQDRTIEAG